MCIPHDAITANRRGLSGHVTDMKLTFGVNEIFGWCVGSMGKCHHQLIHVNLPRRKCSANRIPFRQTCGVHVTRLTFTDSRRVATLKWPASLGSRPRRCRSRIVDRRRGVSRRSCVGVEQSTSFPTDNSFVTFFCSASVVLPSFTQRNLLQAIVRMASSTMPSEEFRAQTVARVALYNDIRTGRSTR